MRVATRSGGHSFPVWSLHDNSILIDFGDFKVLEVDERNRIAKVSPGVTSKELNDVLIEKHGMMFPGGHCPDVGLGGFLLQGGMGWNCRNWGWACESLDAVEVITMQGEAIICSVEQNRDLYWAARGAGPAVVSKFHLKLRPYPKDGFRSSGYIYPCGLYRQAFSWALRITATLDRDTEITATPEEAEAALRPVQETRPAGTLSEWYCREDNLGNLYDKQAKANPKGHRYHTDNAYVQNGADVVAALEEAFLSLPPGKSFAFWSAMSPWSRGDLSDMALSMRSDHYFAIYAVWDDAKEDE
ncbi:FAD binding domain protein, partial [Aspergillus udagawae]